MLCGGNLETELSSSNWSSRSEKEVMTPGNDTLF